MYPFAEGLFAARNQWYVAAWSSEIQRTPQERWILDEPVAFYRTESGEPVALSGRCPHRHFPLGKSRVIGDTIECGYHGITFDRTGRCVRVPSQATVPASCRVKSYPLVEKWCWLWIWPGDPDLADPQLIPDHTTLGLTDPAFDTAPVLYTQVDGRYQLMHDNLFDLTHLGFLHKTTIGAGALNEVKEHRAQGDNWISSTRLIRDVDCPPYYVAAFGYSGKVNREFGMKLHLPALHVGFDNLTRSQTDTHLPGAPLGRFRVYHAITPRTRHSAHYFFALGRDFALGDPDMTQALTNGIRPTIDEDLLATREIEQMIQSLPQLPSELLVRSDTTCVQGRRLFEQMIRKERSANPAPQQQATTASLPATAPQA